MTSRARFLAALLVAPAVLAALAACGSAPPRRGGYYQNDGPPDRVPGDMASTPDALPAVEPVRPQNARAYSVLGRGYTPMTQLRPYRERGLASWYGRQFNGEMTASGERYDMFAMTAAHRTLPIPSYARVTSVRSGRSVIVRVNDRGPFHEDRILDLSYAAAVRLGGPNVGTQLVDVELLMPDEIAQIRASRGRGADTVLAASSGSTGGTPAAAVPTVEVPAAMVKPVSTAPAASAPPATTATDSTIDAAGTVAIQVGAYSVRANADTMLERIARALPDLAPRAAIVQRDGLYRVRIGPYADAMQAVADRERLRDGFPEPALLVDPR